MYIYIKMGDPSITMIDPCDSEKKSKAIFSLKQQIEKCFSSLAREKTASRDTRRAYFLFFSLLGKDDFDFLSPIKRIDRIIFAKGNLP